MYSKIKNVGILAVMLMFSIMCLSVSVSAVTYTSITDGNWNAGSTWAGGAAPSSTISAADTVLVRHSISYNTGSPLINHGTIIVERFAGSTARLLLPTNINVENYADKPRGFYIRNAKLLQCRFAGPALCTDNNGEPYVGTAPQAAKLSGTFKNLGGYVELVNADVEVAQDWTSENGGERLMVNSCLRTGQNYSLSGSTSFDTIIGSNISIGWHTSGNFDLSDGTIHFTNTKVQLAGTSGNFKLNSGKAFGDIDYITFRNHRTNPTPPPNGPPAGSIGSGELFASSSLTTSGTSAAGAPVNGLVLDAYCVVSGGQYKPNAKFSGTQQPNCSLGFSTNDCEALVPSAGGAIVEGRVFGTNGYAIRGAVLVLQGGQLQSPILARTNAFGWFQFVDIPVGQTYILSVSAKGRDFADPIRTISLTEDLSGIEFVSETGGELVRPSKDDNK